MNIINNLTDDQFEWGGTPHTRIIARAILFNDEGRIALCHVKRNDAFGNCDYVETPGGGVELGETLEAGVLRELEEETGCKAEIIEELGIVNDFYNKIGRKNENHYFLCHVLREGKIHHVSEGDSLISEILWVSIEEGIQSYCRMKDVGLEVLVKRRELPVLLMVRDEIHAASEHLKSRGVN